MAQPISRRQEKFTEETAPRFTIEFPDKCKTFTPRHCIVFYAEELGDGKFKTTILRHTLLKDGIPEDIEQVATLFQTIIDYAVKTALKEALTLDLLGTLEVLARLRQK